MLFAFCCFYLNFTSKIKLCWNLIACVWIELILSLFFHKLVKVVYEKQLIKILFSLVKAYELI